MLAGLVVNVQDDSWQQTAIAIGTLVGALGFVAAAVGTFLAWRGLKENSKGRHAQIAVDLGRRWDERGMARVRRAIETFSPEDFRNYNRKLTRRYYGPFGKVFGATYADVDAFASFFEDLGVLNKLDILNTEWIDETLGGAVRDYWRMWHLVAADERTKNPKVYENWERLALRIWVRRREEARRNALDGFRRQREVRRQRERMAAARLADPFSMLP